MPIAKSAAIKAMQLDQNSAMVHTILGIIKLTDWDWTGAKQELKLATVMDPNNYESRHWYSLYLSAMGRHEEAIREAKVANELKSPAGSKIGYGSILYFAHEFEQMVKLLEAAIIDEPDVAPLDDWLGMAYVQLREYDKSIEVYRKAVDLSDGLVEIMAGLGHAYGMAGRLDEACAVAFAREGGKIAIAAYASSKGAIVSFTSTVALDHANDNIRCNCIAPGSIQTPMLDDAAKLFGPKCNPSQAIKEWGDLHPLKRVGRADEVPKLVLFLVSDDSSFCTGGCYRIEGGLLSALF